MNDIPITWYEHLCGVILSLSKSWERLVYLFSPKGIGDCMFRTGIWAAVNKSYKQFYTVTQWLLERKRWPDEFNNNHMARNRVQWRWSQLLFMIEIQKTVLYRPQGHMTRDPYISYYRTAMVLGMDWWIEKIKIPWYLYRPTVWAWRRFLITGSRWSYWWYDTFRCKGRKEYVNILANMMEEAVNIKKQRDGKQI